MPRRPTFRHSQHFLAKLMGISRACVDRMVRDGVNLDDICEVDHFLRYQTKAKLGVAALWIKQGRELPVLWF
jgi:hypothetical protein